jgi:glycosyltransferase involved in cell wall biosynthesis
MHVFFDDQIFVLQAEGGISRYFTELAKELGGSGVRVRLFAGIARNQYLEPLRKAPGLSVRFCQRKDRLRINKSVARLSRLWRRWDFTWYRRRVSPLIYHATNYQVDPWIARRADATVLTCFDMIGELFGSEEERARSLARKRIALALADAALCISEQTKADVQALLPRCATPLEVTPLAASLPIPPAEALSTVRKYAPFLLLVGNRHGYKNGAAGLDAFTRLSACHSQLRMVCFGGEPLNAAEVNALKKAGATDRVVCLRGSDEFLAAHYAEAVALLYPSRYEGFGLPVLEAMQLGCPVLTTPNASLPEVGGDAVVYVEPDDVEGMVVATERLIRDEAWRARLIQAGRLRAQSFSWRRTAEGTRLVYESLAPEPKGPRWQVRSST